MDASAQIQSDPSTDLAPLQKLAMPLSKGIELLRDPLLNKGTAFSLEERTSLGLHGLLPPNVETIETQITRAYEAFQQKSTNLERYIYLRRIQDTNETLFYALISRHLEELMPVIYTPVVGEACRHYSTIYRAPRGLYLSFPLKDHIEEMLDNSPIKNPQVIVATDGERILGIGDQGAGGMGIPIGKLSLYTVCGGIDPSRVLPIMLDLGTNNPELRKNPLYIGWQHDRVTGKDYDDFMDTFVAAIKKKYPDVLLQWEDFAKTNATRVLEKYRGQICSFNDDIQGTAAVTTGALLSAVAATGRPLRDEKVVILGAGSAGCGIAEQIMRAMVNEGLSPEEASKRFYLVDRNGLLREGSGETYMDFQKHFVHSTADLDGWVPDPTKPFDLQDVIRNVKPGILIGVSGQPGLFTKEVIEEMIAGCTRPIVFPLSNPTAFAEATPADVITWSRGSAIVATGSPFAPVQYSGKEFTISQCNNSYIFPGLGLGILAARATAVSDGMLMAAAKALAESSPMIADSTAALLPPLSSMTDLSKKIALQVAKCAQSEGLATPTSEEALEERIAELFWEPVYR